jgi:hypothetical protein
MRLTRRLTLLATAALLLLSLAASGASADALRLGGAPVAVPFVKGMASTNVVFNGVFAGQPISCANSGIVTNVTTNNVFGAAVLGDLNNWTFAGCTTPGGVACTVVANGLPWGGAVRMDVGPPKTYTAIFPTAGSLTITCNPAGGAVTCTYFGGGAVPLGSVQGLWTDAIPGGPARVTFVNAPLSRIVPSAAACGAVSTYSGVYFTVFNNFTLTV